MGFFDLFKNSSTGEVWRNKSGKIACPGDRCPKECDSTCPIYLNTQAMQLMITGNSLGAIPLYEEAVKIAPDFYDAWNNMAALYGDSRNFEKAYECYIKAHECAPNKHQPLFGLALVTRDLKRYDECIKWCEDYKELAKDGKADKIRSEAIEARFQASKKEEGDRLQSAGSEKPTIVMANQVLSELIKNDLNNGLHIEEKEPIDELANEAGHITHEIFDYVKDYYISEVNKGKIAEEDLSQFIFHTSMVWSVLAGIGAMELWIIDRENLMSKGIVESLTEESGFFAMDEFVLNMVAGGFESDEANELKQRLEEQIQPLYFKLFTDFLADGADRDARSHQFINYCIALYWYGLVLQKDRSKNKYESCEEGLKEDGAYTDEDVAESELSNEEKCGFAWLQIAGKKDMDKGLAMMRELGDDGFDEGYLSLAMFTENQNGRMALLKKAADAGNAEAKWQYANYIPHSPAANLGTGKDKTFLKCCTEAAAGGCSDAMNELGNIAHRRHNHAESMYWYAMANAYGHKDGQVSMEGIAKEWISMGKPYNHTKITEGFDEARFVCALTYLELYAGVAPTHNIDDIFKLALDGTPLAAYLAGDIYESQGMLEMAYTTYNTIAFDNDPHGLKCYADMIMTGRGTTQRPTEAFKVYEKAAVVGDRESMFTMGEYCRNNGNINLAAYWYGKAYARGYEPAEVRLLQIASRT